MEQNKQQLYDLVTDAEKILARMKFAALWHYPKRKDVMAGEMTMLKSLLDEAELLLHGQQPNSDTKPPLPQAAVTCRAYRTWLQQVKKEQKHYKLFKGVDLNEADLFELWQEGKSPVDALNDLSTAC